MDFCVFCWGLCAAVTGWVGDAEMREEGCREERSLVKVMAGDQDQGLESKQSWSWFNEMLRPKSWQQVVQKWNEGLRLWMEWSLRILGGWTFLCTPSAQGCSWCQPVMGLCQQQGASGPHGREKR